MMALGKNLLFQYLKPLCLDVERIPEGLWRLFSVQGWVLQDLLALGFWLVYSNTVDSVFLTVILSVV